MVLDSIRKISDLKIEANDKRINSIIAGSKIISNDDAIKMIELLDNKYDIGEPMNFDFDNLEDDDNSVNSGKYSYVMHEGNKVLFLNVRSNESLFTIFIVNCAGNKIKGATRSLLSAAKIIMQREVNKYGKKFILKSDVLDKNISRLYSSPGFDILGKNFKCVNKTSILERYEGIFFPN